MLYEFDKKFRNKYKIIAGVDEAGRGPLAGPVVAAAVILPEDFNLNLINDSKKLSPPKREKAFFLIKKNALALSVTSIPNYVIDKINILNATLLAMKKSIHKLKIHPDLVLIDGNKTPCSEYKEIAIEKGDSKSLSIASASIVAKYIRDKIMDYYSKIYPEYEFSKHKGYPTKRHKYLIKKFGPTKIHRRSFKGVISREIW